MKKRAEKTAPLRTDSARWPRKAFLEDALAKFEAIAVVAEGDSSWTAAVKAREAALAIRAELDRLVQAKKRAAKPRSLIAHKAEVLTVTRRLRLAASDAGSHVAAANLLQLEGE